MKGGHLQLKQGNNSVRGSFAKAVKQMVCWLPTSMSPPSRCGLWPDLGGDVAVLAGDLWRRPRNCSETDGGSGRPRRPSWRAEDRGWDQSTLRFQRRGSESFNQWINSLESLSTRFRGYHCFGISSQHLHSSWPGRDFKQPARILWINSCRSTSVWILWCPNFSL